jgi:hypothetical protein
MKKLMLAAIMAALAIGISTQAFADHRGPSYRGGPVHDIGGHHRDHGRRHFDRRGDGHREDRRLSRDHRDHGDHRDHRDHRDRWDRGHDGWRSHGGRR